MGRGRQRKCDECGAISDDYVVTRCPKGIRCRKCEGLRKQKYLAEYYKVHAEKARAYGMAYRRKHPKDKRKRCTKCEGGYILWMLVSRRSGGCMGIKFTYRRQEKPAVRRKEQLEWNVYELGRQPVEKFARLVDLALVGRRLLTM